MRVLWVRTRIGEGGVDLEVYCVRWRVSSAFVPTENTDVFRFYSFLPVQAQKARAAIARRYPSRG